MKATLSFFVADGASTRDLDIETNSLVIAGWAGRDEAAVQAHIHELAEIGVPAPTQTPCFYRVTANQLTTEGSLQMLGNKTSGEVEYVIVSSNGELWIGVGSDETDREAEAYSVAAAKQLCPKSIAPVLWLFSEVEGHWDDLILRAWIFEDGQRRIYQEAPISSLRKPMDLVECYLGGDRSLPSATIVYGGTIGVIGKIRGGTRFEYELEDPVLGRTIRHGYDVIALPVVA